MKLSESPFIHLLRSVTLLTALLAVPGIAIGWNHLPAGFSKSFGCSPAAKPAAPKIEKSKITHKDSHASATPLSDSAFASETMGLGGIDTMISLPTPKVASEAMPPEVAVQQVAWEHSPAAVAQNFESLEQHLKALGATYYRLEKWGNRGELFRFSCFVTPSEPYLYEKHFQAIGADAVSVMRSVIAEITAWKNTN
ncbi:MAG: hypothetical protein LBI05_06245 [Planctomycetaceae bacterium]|jgi:hypothetical protein|nr:hypothetical protein [Planctomycetaceae bacterium]